MQNYKKVSLILVIAVLLALLVSPFASSSPDGLEWVAETKGFIEKAESFVVWKASVMPDYKVSFINNEGFSTSIAGVIGTVICFVAAIALFKMFGKRVNEKNNS